MHIYCKIIYKTFTDILIGEFILHPQVTCKQSHESARKSSTTSKVKLPLADTKEWNPGIPKLATILDLKGLIFPLES